MVGARHIAHEVKRLMTRDHEADLGSTKCHCKPYESMSPRCLFEGLKTYVSSFKMSRYEAG